jgi:hypothetical protein
MNTSEYKLLTVPLSEIEIGERRRQDDGDIARLAAGIRKVGLLHPLIVRRVDGHYELVAGERRLKALRTLRIAAAPVRLYESLTDEELREIELEENENRKDFTAAERERTFAKSKQLVEDAQRAEEIISGAPPEKDPRGRKSQRAAPKEAIAESVGTSKRSLERAEQHVGLAEAFPFMQKWRQSEVLAIHEALHALPEVERQDAGAVLGCATILSAEDAAMMLRNLAAKKPSDRAAVYALAHSNDQRERDLALTTAAEQPPMPDPRLNWIDTAISALRQASKPYPNDPLTPEFEGCISDLRRLKAKVREVSFDARRDSKKGRIQ